MDHLPALIDKVQMLERTLIKCVATLDKQTEEIEYLKLVLAENSIYYKGAHSRSPSQRPLSKQMQITHNIPSNNNNNVSINNINTNINNNKNNQNRTSKEYIPNIALFTPSSSLSSEPNHVSTSSTSTFFSRQKTNNSIAASNTIVTIQPVSPRPATYHQHQYYSNNRPFTARNTRPISQTYKTTTNNSPSQVTTSLTYSVNRLPLVHMPSCSDYYGTNKHVSSTVFSSPMNPPARNKEPECSNSSGTLNSFSSPQQNFGTDILRPARIPLPSFKDDLIEPKLKSQNLIEREGRSKKENQENKGFKLNDCEVVDANDDYIPESIQPNIKPKLKLVSPVKIKCKRENPFTESVILTFDKSSNLKRPPIDVGTLRLVVIKSDTLTISEVFVISKTSATIGNQSNDTIILNFSKDLYPEKFCTIGYDSYLNYYTITRDLSDVSILLDQVEMSLVPTRLNHNQKIKILNTELLVHCHNQTISECNECGPHTVKKRLLNTKGELQIDDSLNLNKFDSERFRKVMRRIPS